MIFKVGFASQSLEKRSANWVAAHRRTKPNVRSRLTELTPELREACQTGGGLPYRYSGRSLLPERTHSCHNMSLPSFSWPAPE